MEIHKTLLLLAALVSGCGGGGGGDHDVAAAPPGSGPSPSAPPSREEPLPPAPPGTSASSPSATPAPGPVPPVVPEPAPLPDAGASAPLSPAPTPAPAPTPPPIDSAPPLPPPVSVPVTSLIGSPLPGLITSVFKGGYAGGSAGKLSVEDPASFVPSIASNGLDGTGAHQIGFALTSASDPIRSEPFSVPLSVGGTEAASGLLAGVPTIRRYGVQLDVAQFNQINASRWQSEHVLSGPVTNYAAFGLWSTVQPPFTGYFSGTPTWWGAYVYGTPTLPADLQAIVTKRLGGLAGGQWLFPGVLQFGSHYGVVSVAFDAPRSIVTVMFQLTRTHSLAYALPYPRGYSDYEAPFSPQTAVADGPFECDAPVDMANGTFSCEVAGGSGGSLRGRFYGPNGDEVAGVFSRWEWSGPSTNWGVIGGFVAKASMVDVEATTATKRRP